MQGFLHCQGISPQLQNTWDTVRVTSGEKRAKSGPLRREKLKHRNDSTCYNYTTLAIVCPWHGYGSPQRAAPSVHPLIHKLQCTRAFPPSARGQCHYVWSKASLGPQTLRACKPLNIHTVTSTWSVHVTGLKTVLRWKVYMYSNRLLTLKILALSRAWISWSESTTWIATTADWESLGITCEPVVGWRIREVRKGSRMGSTPT